MIGSLPDQVRRGRLWVLTGAGISTDSGIPDYRGPNAPVRMPMTYQEFVATPEAQQRYWARAHVGWARMRAAEPNPGHRALTALEHLGAVQLLVTQNVDRLHSRAGSRNVVDLHGRIDQVRCLDCSLVFSRGAVQAQMTLANPEHVRRHRDATSRPDGDVEVDDTSSFRVPRCAGCRGRLKPDVVFFGENVPKPTVAHCFDELAEADGVLVVGSSLAVMSGLRFVKRAARIGVPVVIVNRGSTRGDDLAAVKLDAGCSEFLGEFSRFRAGDRARVQ